MSNITVAVVSLGCPKNQCDAELMLAKIADAGYTLVSEAGLADVVIINTCCFIQSAKEEAIEEILEAVSRKSDRRAATGKSSMVTSSTVYEPGSDHKIIITGCMAQRYRNDLAAEFPEADGIVGIGHNDDIVQVITDVLRGESAQQVLLSEPERHNMEGARLLSTMPHYAYLRIADGCDNRCSYCAIPLFRGKFRSRAADNIIAEAQSLADKGVKELILIAQDVTNYGADLSQNDNLANLLKRLAQIDKIKWIRLLYCYPQRISDDLIDVIKSNDKVIKYLDLPVQHCNDTILADMNRKFTKQQLTDLLCKLREQIPDLVLRTTFITGFPGETPEQFTELAEFAHEMRFTHLGCFAYSQEEGTPAAEMPDQIDENERLRRCEIITEQQEIRVAEWAEARVGEVYETVVEGYDKFAEMFFGRTYMHAPEIDGMVYFKSEKTGQSLSLGDFVNVKITEVIDNNLLGVIESV